MSAPLFTINGRFLLQPVTGVQRYARNVLSGLDAVLGEKGERAELLLPFDTPGNPEAVFANVDARRIGRRWSRRAWQQISLAHATNGPLLNLCNTAPIAVRNQVLCIHDTNIFNAPEAYSAAFRAYYRVVQPLVLRKGVRIATVSAFSAGEIARHLAVPRRHIRVLPNGHEHVFAWDPERSRFAGRGEVSDRPFVLAIGSRARHKNLELLCRLAPELDALGLDVVFAGGDGAIFSQTKGGIAHNMRFLGFVADDDLAWLLDRAMCLAFPSFTEGFGLPVLEAMARGCPVVSSDRSSLPEIASDACLLAAPDDLKQWLDAIAALVESADMRSELSGRGRERAAQFTWRRTAEGYADLMTECVPFPRSAVQAGCHDTDDSDTLPAEPRIAVIYATRSRSSVLEKVVENFVSTQTLVPHRIIVSCTCPDDAGRLAERADIEVLFGRPGLAAQRNRALDRLDAETDIVVFFDDDFVAHPDWLRAAARLFDANRAVSGVTGFVVSDGIKGSGFGFEEAEALLQDFEPLDDTDLLETFSPYGCNMAFRRSAIGSTRFDERLVLYGWLEDRDFGAALAARGGLNVRCRRAIGVHMGTKFGRGSGSQLGYSQIANPLYLMAKGHMTLQDAVRQMAKNIAANLVRSAWPEPFIDRRGRLLGNLQAYRDWRSGCLAPERALEIPKNLVSDKT